MSKRRKNAGEGYGFMFSGAFSEKKDAVAKEKTRKGSFIKGMPTRHGYRYVVMTPRTNPIRRKKREKGPDDVISLKEFRKLLNARGYGGGAAVRGATRAQAEEMIRRLDETHRKHESNPSELLVMGANPHENLQEIVLQPGARLVIRNNPADARPNSLGSMLGFSPSHPTKKQLAESRRGFKQRVRQRVKEDRDEFSRLRRSARSSQKQTGTSKVFHELYGQQLYDQEGLPANPATCGAMIGGYPCTRKPGHRGPHLPQGATLRPRSRHPWGPRGNPSAEALRERFTGRAVDRVQVFDEPHMPKGDYAMLGKVLALYVKPRQGGQVQQIQLPGVIAVSDESARQIYFVGGDQDLSSALHVFGAIDRGAGLFELGEARRIDYKQRKEHVPHPESDSWRHEFGEESGVRPIALYDSRAKRILLEGGEYVIRAEGIVN